MTRASTEPPVTRTVVHYQPCHPDHFVRDFPRRATRQPRTQPALFLRNPMLKPMIGPRSPAFVTAVFAWRSS